MANDTTSTKALVASLLGGVATAATALQAALDGGLTNQEIATVVTVLFAAVSMAVATYFVPNSAKTPTVSADPAPAPSPQTTVTETETETVETDAPPPVG